MESLFDAAGGVEDREGRLEALAQQVSVCTKCDLSETRTNTVFGTGDPTSPLMLIGEGPGENEDATGLPFVGRAGKLLDDILAAVKLSRDKVYLTNVVKCRACVYEGGRWKNRPPKTAEVNACNPYLRAQLETVKPQVILCLGGPAAKSIIDKDFRITKDRGEWHEVYGAKTMATFHPAYVLRQRGDELKETKRLVWKDIQAVRAEYDRAIKERG
ncbi:uracil-DNA glycosylase, family 4 [Rubrobacter radiotolerans]|uniref:Type-4 uracil-DNA glycosylase n=1 Tax=Rubrobacter radiotolerans TaxID=42256 RepID=A0A023X6V2_RUBRA|nr:uracil-DNA glycosylase [Rubrobacter radiotolerans]AHY47799.1 uracil-DNA glycosylase, family 4 [Rubrobacter radiotolerans]MDX5892438.1 uracil-DNA glycosylase [Rubrobacter radiotolerans]SMC07729.1 DNA polymerase [Rubrobacter radiotolerans DSM 5868]